MKYTGGDLRKGTNGVSTNGVTATLISSGKETNGVTASMDRTDNSSERDKWGQHLWGHCKFHVF